MSSPWDDLPDAAAQGRLDARPPDGAAGRGKEPAGEHPLGLGEDRDGVLIVPPGYSPHQPAPLLVFLHGAGGTGVGSLRLIRDAAAAARIVVLAPDSRDATWDVLRGGYGPDVRFIDRTVASVFTRFAIDPGRIAIGGFSDGASYALSLGIANGDLFTHIMALSPGFASPPMQVGTPRLYISHGTEDRVLPIAMCSRILAPMLARAGYDVSYREFVGPHTVPPAIATEACNWLLGQEVPRVPDQ